VSGLIEVKEILKDIPGINFSYFDERDVVRHRLVQDIIKAYDRHGASRDQVASLGRPQDRPGRPDRVKSHQTRPGDGRESQPH
jgi:phosphate starvation-inducible PhoH-like protein